MPPFIASSLIVPVGVLILRIEGRGGARASSGGKLRGWMDGGGHHHGCGEKGTKTTWRKAKTARGSWDWFQKELKSKKRRNKTSLNQCGKC
uniref:Uncharacterized protein n=1 Tax=Oryza nivara TaxID=4536 RepID=A0A0E0IQJ6_ORYNI